MSFVHTIIHRRLKRKREMRLTAASAWAVLAVGLALASCGVAADAVLTDLNIQAISREAACTKELAARGQQDLPAA
jgi:hypothetical protein